MRLYLIMAFIFTHLVLYSQKSDLLSYIKANARALDTASADFQGLNFLDTLLAGKRIVLLGESSHGTQEYSLTKLQLIKYLHKELGFRVLLFESPIAAGAYFNIAADTASAEELLLYTIQSIWHTESVLEVISYLKKEGMYFGGFDPQFMPSPSNRLLPEAAFPEQTDIRQGLLNLEERVNRSFVKDGTYAELKDSFSSTYTDLLKKLNRLPLNPLQGYVRQILSSNARYYAHLNAGNTRDSLMAENLIWLAEQLYPDEKIIVWAHNSHIDKASDSRSKFMGKLLSRHFGPQLYGIGLYMINGTTALNDRTLIPVKKPKGGSLEDLLAQSGFATTFVSTDHPAFAKKITTWHWGKDQQRMNLAKSYDAVILVNGVSAPTYLKHSEE